MYREMSFVAYYYHWNEQELLKQEHRQRRQWCREITRIHKSLNVSGGKEKSILEWGK